MLGALAMSRFTVMFWPAELLNVSVCFRLAAESNSRLTSLTRPRALIVPVPVSWLGEAASDPVVNVPPLGPKAIAPAEPAPKPT